MENCDKCGDTIKDIDGELQDAKCLKFVDEDGTEYFVARCTKCFDKDKSLTNYKKTEVYSRVVGYMRPVSQWNKGKQDEYCKRKTFKNPMTDIIETVTPEVVEEIPTPEVPVEEKTTPVAE
jgi:hypothetical protein